ncbi:MAG: aldo/keto reductase [Candidatus Hydrogenedentes bacterium]|nr:aldo/keto reductase [Candidatus Hydrogenedentota bacterium]
MDTMYYHKLGGSSLNVSVLTFGAWQLGDPAYWGPDAEADGVAAVHAALDAGINFFDTAPMYGAGESERILGRALADHGDRVLIATKVWPDQCAPGKLRAACEASLQRLGMDRIDLYQIHWPCRDVPFDDVYDELRRLEEEGKIRHIGVSNFGPTDLEAWTATGYCTSNQVGYNLLFRAVEYDIVPACRMRNIAILAYMPLMQGILSGRWKSVEEIPVNRRRTRHFSASREGTRHGEPGAEPLLLETLTRLGQVAENIDEPLATVALAWVLAQPGVASAIVGARNPVQLERNLRAISLSLGVETIEQLNLITEPLRRHFGANADMWENDANSRIR